MTTHSARTKPPLNVFFQYRVVFVRMAAAAVDHTNARKACSHGLQQKLFEHEARFLKVESVKIHVRLDGETSGPQILKIEATLRVD